MRSFRTLGALVAAAFAGAAQAAVPAALHPRLDPFMRNYRPPRGAPRRSRNSRPHQGAQECARRRRQIERGMLTRSNGLI